MTTTFIYALCEPGTRMVRYIGKSNDLSRRLKEHLGYSVRLKTHLGYWLKSLVTRGESPEMVELRKVPGDGSEAERRYIRLARGCRMALVNETNGGDGARQGEENHFFGCRHSEETRKKMRGPKSEAHKQNMRKPKSTVEKMQKPKTASHRAALRVSAHTSNQGTKKGGGLFSGVGWMPLKRKWRARIGSHGTQIHLGVFTNDVAAAKAYDAAAIRYYGSSAKLNFPVR